MFEFLTSLICVGLASILFFGISFFVLRAILGVTKAVFLVSCVISLISIFCIDSDISFFTNLLGALCGLVVCYLFVIGDVDICPNCGSWNEFEEIERLNERRWENLANRKVERNIYDTDHNVIGTVDGGRECVERNYYRYDSVRRCKKCGEKKVVHITRSHDSEL